MDVNENADASKTSRAVMSFVRAGLAYLERYGGPRARVRRTLERRARRLQLDPAEGAALVEAAMAKLDGLELIDDRAFAAGKARGLRRRGASRKAAMAKLAATGVDGDLAAAALDALDAEADDDPERQAAERYAERRRLGPWRRDPALRGERRDRDVAALARAGFPVGLAIRVIDGVADD